MKEERTHEFVPPRDGHWAMRILVQASEDILRRRSRSVLSAQHRKLQETGKQWAHSTARPAPQPVVVALVRGEAGVNQSSVAELPIHDDAIPSTVPSYDDSIELCHALYGTRSPIAASGPVQELFVVPLAARRCRVGTGSTSNA